jgi:hypothetical protein
MNSFLLSENYRLEVHWSKVEYTNDGISNILGCYFSGPALKDASELNKSDHINLDFSTQYIIFVPNFYVAKLSWDGVRYEGDRIYVDNVIFENKHLNSVPKLGNSDYLVLDTSAHDTNKMFVKTLNMTTFNMPLSYKSFLIKNDGTYLDFKVIK